MNDIVPVASSRTSGSQTLARGLVILRKVIESPHGLTVNEVAELSGVHRTVAYRILNTLSDARMLYRDSDGRYRGSAGLLPLAAAGYQHLRTACLPVLRQTANELGVTVALLVQEASTAVALAVVSPQYGNYHVAFSEGSHHPIDQGAAGLALLAAAPVASDDPPRVQWARQAGYAQTFGEVEPNMHGLAVPLPLGPDQPTACLLVISVREDQTTQSVASLKRAGEQISAAFAVQTHR